MLFKDFIRNVLMEIGEWSANGAKTSEIANKDYLLSITDFTNQETTQVVTVTRSKRKYLYITQKNPVNGLGKGWKSYTFKGTDQEYVLSGGRSYSFQLGGSAVVHIEELINGVWTLIDTITHAHSPSDGYVLYKGSIDKTDAQNSVKLRFSGTYDYEYRWVALFTEYLEYPVSYESLVEHSLSDDLYLLETVNLLQNDGIYTEYPPKKYELAGKSLILPYELSGEFKIEYAAYPELLIYDEDNININDDTEIDVLDEYIASLINGVAGKLKANVDKKYSVGDRYSAISIDNTNATLSNKQKKAIESPIRGSR